jgi:outer membrane protein W
MRHSISFAFVIAAFVFPSTASAAEPASAGPESGLSFGLRTGYSLPLGKVQGDQTVTTGGTTTTVAGTSLSDAISGRIPIWVDAGYKINRNIYVGAFFQYGIMFVNKDKNPGCNQGGASCSAHDIVLGVNAHYHIMPEAVFDPWVGVGFGYEILGASTTLNGQSQDSSIKGFQFVSLQAGGDYKVTPAFGIGPFLSFSLGQYSTASATQGGNTVSADITNTAMHEWLTIGVRGVYDIAL